MKLGLMLLFCSLLIFTCPVIKGDSLAEQHKGKQFYVAVSPVALFGFANFNRPLSLGYFLKPEFLVGVSKGASRGTFHQGSIQYSSKESSLWVRYFLWGHLDLQTRLRSLDLNFSQHYLAPRSGLRADYTGQFRGQALGLGVGGRWSWKNGLSIAVDGLILNQLIHSTISSQVTANQGVLSTLLDGGIKLGESSVKQLAGLPDIAVLSLGFAF